MTKKLLIVFGFLLVTAAHISCGKNDANSPGTNAVPAEANSGNTLAGSTPATAGAKSDQPRTVRDYFMRLPEKYFVLEGCDRAKDKDCQRAKEDYLRTFIEAEDSANGYLKAGCDGAQSCLEMALFKRPNGTYLIGLVTSNEMINEYVFLDYADGKWADVSAKAVPEFDKKNVYELPQHGTTLHVYSTKATDKGDDDFEIREKDAKLYDLEWKNGKFNKTK